MSQFAAALGAATATVGISAVLVARNWPVADGRHRATSTLPRPVEAVDATAAHCRVQGRTTRHLRLTTGGLCCTECHHTTMGEAK